MDFDVQEGDYVNTTGLGENARRKVVKAFLGAGCPPGEEVGNDYCNVQWRAIGWNQDGIYYHADGAKVFSREITIEQLMSISTEWNGEGLPPIGCEVEYKGSAYLRRWKAGDKIKVVAYSKVDGFFAAYNERLDCSGEGLTAYSLVSTNFVRAIQTEARRLSEAANIKLKTAQKVIDAGYRKESV